MSRKSVVPQYTLVDAVSATGSITSSPINVTSLDELTLHCKFSSANTGEYTVEARNFIPPNASNAELNWYTLNFNETLAVTAETETQIVLSKMAFEQIRLKYVPSVGAGTLTVYASGKVSGA